MGLEEWLQVVGSGAEGVCEAGCYHGNDLGRNRRVKWCSCRDSGLGKIYMELAHDSAKDFATQTTAHSFEHGDVSSKKKCAIQI